MTPLLVTSLFLFIFSAFNLLGIRESLLPKHILFFAIGILFYIGVRKIGVHFFRINAIFFYWFFIGLFLLTFIIGVEVKGSKRWIDFYFFSFQSSEFFKIFFILFFAEQLSSNRRQMNDFSFLIKNILYFLLPALIIFKQPDLGNFMVYTFIFIVLMLFSEIPKKYIFICAIIIGLLMPFSWLILKDYQKARLVSFFNPHIDQQGTSYNMIQSIITIGSGKLAGKGLGLGTQTQLLFLPENHTDFAFASLIEQFGFLGGFMVIGLYIVIASILFKKILFYYYQKDVQGRFKFLFTLGFFSFFAFQVFVNIGMNLGLLPITGITLPLISYGGSALLTWALGLAILP